MHSPSSANVRASLAPAYPYRRFQSVFDQLQTIVYGDLPRLPAETFSKEAVDFCAQWYAAVAAAGT